MLELLQDGLTNNCVGQGWRICMRTAYMSLATDVLIHVRTGDDYTKRGLGNPRNLNIYLKQINKIPKDKTIVLVTTMHYGHAEFDSLYAARTWLYSEKSRNKNIDLLHDFIKQIPHEVKIQSSVDTDIDFLHLILAKNIVALNTSGGFSRVIDILNKLFH